MVHEINVEKVQQKDQKDQKGPQESAKPLDPVRGEQLERTSRGRPLKRSSEEVSLSLGDSRASSEASRTSAESDRTSSRDSFISSRDGSPSPEGRRRDGGLFSRDTSPSPEGRLDRLVSSKIDKDIIPENIFSSRDKKEKKGFAKSAWEILKKPLKSQATLMVGMQLDSGLGNAAKLVGGPEDAILHAQSGGDSSGNMPPYFPNSSDSGKKDEKEKGDKTKNGEKGEVLASKSEMKPEAHGALKEPEGALKKPEGALKEPEGALKKPEGALKKPEGALKEPEGIKEHKGNVADALVRGALLGLWNYW